MSHTRKVLEKHNTPFFWIMLFVGLLGMAGVLEPDETTFEPSDSQIERQR